MTAARSELVFVCGCDRSGTTLTANLLAGSDPARRRHPRGPVRRRLPARGPGTWDPGALRRLPPRRRPLRHVAGPARAGLERRLLAADGIGDALALLAAAHHGLDEAPALVVDQTPWSIAYVDLLRRHVPGARFVERRPRRPSGARQPPRPAVGPEHRGADGGVLDGSSRPGGLRRRRPRAVACTTVRYEDVVARHRRHARRVWAAFGRRSRQRRAAGERRLRRRPGRRALPPAAGWRHRRRPDRGLAPGPWRPTRSRPSSSGPATCSPTTATSSCTAATPAARRRRRRLQDGLREFVRFYALNPARRRRDQRSITG